MKFLAEHRRKLSRVAITALLCASMGACGNGGGGNGQNPTRLSSPQADAGDFCYAVSGKFPLPTSSHATVSHDVLILVDQTSGFPDELKAQVSAQILGLLQPGTRISIGAFSSYSGSDFAAGLFETRIEPEFPADQRGSAPKHRLTQLDDCLSQRLTAQKSLLTDALAKAMVAGRTDIKYSDIMISIREFSKLFQHSSSPTTLVVVSDMLENSTAASFYNNGILRRIDPDAELAIATANQMLPVLPKSKVFVFGAGLIPDGSRQQYRSVQEVEALEKFWKSYFLAGGAGSVSVGKPLLIGESVS